MADRTLSASTSLTGSQVDLSNDQLMILDVSDTSDGAGGTNKKITPTEFMGVIPTVYDTINTQTGDYTFVAADFTIPTLILMNKATGQALTFPPNASVSIPIGAKISGIAIGVGVTTFTPGAGVTLNTSSGGMLSPGQNVPWTAEKTATNTWYISNGIPNTSQTAGGTDTYTIGATSPASYTTGESFDVLFTNGNTGAATLNRNSLGAKALVDSENTALVYGDIQAGAIYRVVYDGTSYRIIDFLSRVKRIVTLANDVTNNNAVADTMQDVTGLSFPVKSGKKYWFRFFYTFSSAATTTGSRWSINGPATTYLCYYSTYTLTPGSITQNQSRNAYDSPGAANASTAVTGGNTAIVEGLIQPSADGTVIGRFASEISGSAIVALGGFCFVEYQVIG